MTFQISDKILQLSQKVHELRIWMFKVFIKEVVNEEASVKSVLAKTVQLYVCVHSCLYGYAQHQMFT